MKTNLILDEGLAFFALSSCRTNRHVYNRKNKLFNLRARICECAYEHIHIHENESRDIRRLLEVDYKLKESRRILEILSDRLFEWKEKVKGKIRKSNYRFEALNDSWQILADGITGGKIYENE